jgi:hypothetical protein
VFYTVPISLEVVVGLGVVGSLVLWVEEIRKLIARGRERRRSAGAPRDDRPLCEGPTDAHTAA